MASIGYGLNRARSPKVALNISVVVVNFNSGPFLKGVVEQLHAQPANYDVIVIDNRSSDGSTDFLRDTHRARLVALDRNLGFGAAANIGAGKANGDYILFLNPDAFVGMDTPALMADYLASSSEHGLCGAFLLDFHGREQAGSRRRDPTLIRACGKVLKSIVAKSPVPTFDQNREALPTGPVSVEAVSGACMMVKSAVHREIGGFDEKYFLHFEDLDYCRRIRDRGWVIGFLPQAPAFHYQGGSGSTSERTLLYHKQAGLRRYLNKFDGVSGGLKILRNAGLEILGCAGRLAIGLNKASRARNLLRVDHDAGSRQVLVGEVLTGAHPVVLVFGARSDVGEALCARLNALGLITVCVTRTVNEIRQSPLMVTIHPDLLLRNQLGARIDVAAMVSVCPIWELPRYQAFLEAIHNPSQLWLVLSSTSVTTKSNPEARNTNAVAARLGQGEAWLNTLRRGSSGPTVMVRPTLIYGGGRNRNINNLKQIARISRLRLDLDFARGLRSPVHCDDLAQWMTAIVARGPYPGDQQLSGIQCVEISGAQALSFRDLVCYAADVSGATTADLTLSRTTVRLLLRLFGWLPVFREVPKDFISRLERDFLFPNDNALSLQAGKMRRFYP